MQQINKQQTLHKFYNPNKEIQANNAAKENILSFQKGQKHKSQKQDKTRNIHSIKTLLIGKIEKENSRRVNYQIREKEDGR